MKCVADLFYLIVYKLTYSIERQVDYWLCLNLELFHFNDHLDWLRSICVIHGK